MDTGAFDFVHELGPQPSGPQAANDLAVLDAGLLEGKDVHRSDDLAFHAANLGDGHHPAAAIP